MVRSTFLSTWVEFKQRLDEYFFLSPERRNSLIFRGQADSKWPLKTTLDRERNFDAPEQRASLLERLMAEFKREAAGLPFELGVPQEEAEWELLARHHGLPTPFLDWTRLPYLAAFFAFADPSVQKADTVSIWVLDLEAFNQKHLPRIEVIDDIETIRINRRAIQQRGVFLRIGWLGQTLEEELQQFVFRYDIPASERSRALNELDEMTINAKTLFADLDRAAQTAAWRVIESEGS